ncbi:peptidase [Rhizobium rhizogenes]|jgi:prepilin peptidase CpaA|uniref:Peptidase n=2 Tax=Rhizobium/Agrobacterium group TaxID=227290 RepID=A0AB36EGP6_AGRTU|nr:MULTISPECIES: prepilin peptidase [Rhizobium/Agrobacterium group]MDX8323690.1 prepilin peptidase [Agrobacterium tumefaciens]OCJ34896.1 peptidase [Agrobacterium tumefaciens]TRA92016.1 peptidase [Rhizobium rhizogenes]UXS97672.1 peptidase [Agrobacterium tumefaciens]UXT82323.1 peptidase [Agrobacterium tumefaciens]
MVVAAIFLTLPLCLAFAALNDLFSMTIPNRIPLILLLSFIVVAPFTGMEWQTFAMSIAAAAAVFFACFALFAANVMGGGDAKLLTAAAVWYGFNASLIEFLLAVTFIGGVLTLGILLLRSRSQEIMAAGIPIPDSLLVAKKIPYGIGIAIAGLLTYGETPLVKAAIASLS